MDSILIVLRVGSVVLALVAELVVELLSAAELVVALSKYPMIAQRQRY